MLEQLRNRASVDSDWEAGSSWVSKLCQLMARFPYSKKTQVLDLICLNRTLEDVSQVLEKEQAVRFFIRWPSDPSVGVTGIEPAASISRIQNRNVIPQTRLATQNHTITCKLACKLIEIRSRVQKVHTVHPFQMVSA